jgi:hypothetical protein
MAFRHLAALREADRIHAIRVEKARALGLSLADYHEQIECGESEGGLAPCPFCGTLMHVHEHCFSHPKPASGDCILRHYSFSDVEAWNSRVP